jgi:prepilin-type processing-associated H-X9-DG protein
MGGTAESPMTEPWFVPSDQSNHMMQSIFVGLTPYIEQQALWEQISNPNTVDLAQPGTVRNPAWPPMGPTPTDEDNYIGSGVNLRNTAYAPWMTEIPTLRCPSDPGVGLPAMGRTNYAACLGDSYLFQSQGLRFAFLNELNAWAATLLKASARGVFVGRADMRFRDILDGLSNTIMAGEIATDLGDRAISTLAPGYFIGGQDMTDNPAICRSEIDPDRPQFWNPGFDELLAANQGRGFRWANGHFPYTVCNTVLPPNAELCMAGGESGWGVVPPSSRHQGGAHVLMADGAVRFVTDSIEAGSPFSSTVWDFEIAGHPNYAGIAPPPGSPSPYGLWGALGTRASKEVIDEAF